MTLFFIRGGAVMRITIAGGGNIGTQFAVHTAEKGHEVTIFTSNPGLFRERLSIVDKSGNTITTVISVELVFFVIDLLVLQQ